MSQQPLVSIIIPTYNRADLIGETLDSVLAQTYQNWECIVVDDGSTDHTAKLLDFYTEKDSRIQYYQRPKNRPKGGNACRNYGFEVSKGEYIQWFDSDDLMTENHVDVLLTTLLKNKVDFTVGNCMNFDDQSGEKLDFPYSFDRKNYSISALSFAKHNVCWTTIDFLVKKSLIEDIKFNETLENGQEYNLFVRFLKKNNNGLIVDQILSFRRIHPFTIGSNLEKANRQIATQSIIKLKYLTFINLRHSKDKELKKWFLDGYIHYAFELSKNGDWPQFYPQSVLKIFREKSIIKGIVFCISIFTGKFFGKGYNLAKFARKS